MTCTYKGFIARIFLPLLFIGIIQYFSTPIAFASTFPIIFSDDFNNSSDGTSLTAHNNNWTTFLGAAEIQTETLVAPSDQGAWFDVRKPATDQCGSYDFAYPLTGTTDLYLRAKDQPDPWSQGGYEFHMGDIGAGNVHIADAYGWVSDEYDLSVLSTGTHHFEACVIGNQLRAYIDNAQVLSVTARNTYTDGYPQFAMSQGAAIDNFEYQGIVVPTRPPVLDPIGNKTVGEGHLLEFTVSATDPDGDNLT